MRGNPNNNWLGMRHISEHFFRWANRVAELVCHEFPDKWLGCLGYANVFQAPSETTVHPRIVVYHTYDRHKWIHPDLEQAGHQMAEAWQAVCPNMAWYDYTFGCSFMAPRIYHHHMAEYLRYGRDMGIMGINGESCHNWAEAPKYYLMARLYWNPDIDVDAVLNEWYELAVGVEAAPFLAEYYNLWETFWTTRILDSSAFSPAAQQWLPIQNDTYFDVLETADFIVSRRFLYQVVAKAATATDAQKVRAHMLLKGFEYYEASAQARLPDRDAGRMEITSEAQGLSLIDVAILSAEAQERRQVVDSALSQDPVMHRITVSWPATERSDWGVYALWRLFEWIDQTPAIRRRIEHLSKAKNNVLLSAHGQTMLNILDGVTEPVGGVILGRDSKIQTLAIHDDSPLSFEPGDRMETMSWQLTLGDDLLPFWNAPHIGQEGKMCYEADHGRTGGLVICEGANFGTIRKKYRPLEGKYTALRFVRIPDGGRTSGQVVLNTWEIIIDQHNPSPFRTVAIPQPGVWTPIAVTGDVRRSDYVLLEMEVEGFSSGERLEVADLAIYAFHA